MEQERQEIARIMERKILIFIMEIILYCEKKMKERGLSLTLNLTIER